MSITTRSVAVLATALTFTTFVSTVARADGGVSPAEVNEQADPGAVIHITKTVHTPEVPPKPDVVLLVDHTGSMGPAINDVKAQMNSVINAVKASQPNAQFAVAQYCDTGDVTGANPFDVLQGRTADTTAVNNAVDAITLCDGGDMPEAQLNALFQVASGAITFRSGSSPIIAWFGDAPGHDPSLGHSEAEATSALVGIGAKVVAVNVQTASGAGLNSTGQAGRIINATGGVLKNASEGGVAEAIVAGLTSLPVTVAGDPTCDDGLSIDLDPNSKTVTSGNDAVFDEKIKVSASAPEGATLSCTVQFTLDGTSGGGDFQQSVTIKVNDVTPPSVSCPEGPNPAGNVPASHNPDGFYKMVATDNVDKHVEITITDTVSGKVFGPYPSGTTFKLTQAPGAVPKVTNGTGAVDLKVKLKGDALLTATDNAGNSATALCEVPPN